MSDWSQTPPEVASIMGVLDTYVRWKNIESAKSRGYLNYHPSAFGKCLRRMQYQLYAEKELIQVSPSEFSSQQLRLFDKGHNMHRRWAEYFTKIGVLRGVWRCLNPLCASFSDNGELQGVDESFRLNEVAYKKHSRCYGMNELIGCFRPEKCVCGCNKFEYEEILIEREDLNFRGHCDMVLDFCNLPENKWEGVQRTFDLKQLPKGPVVVDMKTVNEFGFKQILKNGPSLEYEIQLVIYCNILNCDFGVLIYENKNNSSTAAFKISKQSSTVFAEVERQAKLMVEMAKTKKLPPPRPFNKDDYECSNCEFKSLCHTSKLWEDEEALKEVRKRFYGKLLKA